MLTERDVRWSWGWRRDWWSVVWPSADLPATVWSIHGTAWARVQQSTNKQSPVTGNAARPPLCEIAVSALCLNTNANSVSSVLVSSASEQTVYFQKYVLQMKRIIRMACTLRCFYRASAGNACRLRYCFTTSVRLSVQAGIVSQRLNISSQVFNDVLTVSF